MIKRKPSPKSVHDRAFRRGLIIARARHGGWVVLLHNMMLYASHSWPMIREFINTRPIIIKRKDM